MRVLERGRTRTAPTDAPTGLNYDVSLLRIKPENQTVRIIGGSGWKFDPSDSSEAAQEWRSRPLVRRATEVMRQLPYRYGGRRIRFNLSDPHATISLAELAHAFELAHGEVGINPRMLDGGGSQQAQFAGISMFGVASGQSVIDSHTIHEILWRLQPDLVI